MKFNKDIQIIKHIANTNGYDVQLIDQLQIKIEKKNKNKINTTLMNNTEDKKYVKFNYTRPINHKIAKVFKKYNITAYRSDNKIINNINITIKTTQGKKIKKTKVYIELIAKIAISFISE